MKIKEVTFHHFRSFGAQKASIDFDENINFFVGKNHTGKSNLMKFMDNIQQHNLPLNDEYILERSNWYNNESGIDRPLKFRFDLLLEEGEYQYFCESIILEPLIRFFNRIATDKFIPSEIFSYDLLKGQFKNVFPLSEAILRMEFIRLDESTQKINYSIQFNNLMIIKTRDGRRFIQFILEDDENAENRPRETSEWDQFLGNTLETLLKLDDEENFLEAIGTIHNSKHETSKEIIHELITSIQTEIRPFIISAEAIIDPVYRTFINRIVIVKGTLPSIPELEKNHSMSLETFLALLLSRVESKAEHDATLRKRLYRLREYFESMFSSLEITYAVKKQENNLRIYYYKLGTQNPVQNYDSIGTGISEMLYFLYKLTIEENNMIFIDSPEIYLHPHNQRYLYTVIKQFSDQNQVFLTTHSPFFIQPEDLFQIRLFDLEEDLTVVRKLNIPSNSHDYLRLKRNFDMRNRDAIFADGIIFVEGPTEEWAFPTFFRNFGLDMDLNNISLINLYGKGGFAAYWKFAHQLRKKFWFFFDNDVLGVKAGEKITPKTFRRSEIYKRRNMISPEVAQICNELEFMENNIEFHEKLEYLRSLLEKYQVFIFKTDFEDAFEVHLEGKIELRGSKVDKAIQLVDFLRNHESEQMLPERLYYYIELIQEDLKK